LELLEAILRPKQYQIWRGSSGEDAIRIAGEITPDLVIMDVRMPRVTGFEACKTIKENCEDRFIPVMLLTNLDDTESKVLGLDSGADEYMVKPPSKAELLARVRALLRIRDLSYNLIMSRKQIEETNNELMKAQKINEDEMERIGAIQRSFIPRRFPFHPKIAFGHYYGPCTQAGGDYFDIIEIGKAHLGLLIADVTGHGTPAAVVMAITHTLMHSFISSFHYPSTALKVANEKLNEHLAPTFYVTMFYGVLNLDSMLFRFSSAGHEPMMVYRYESQQIEYLKTEYGYPLKLLESDDYDEKEITLQPNDKLILFTDGVVETRNNAKELFTSQRLETLVHKYHHLPAQAFVDAIITEVKAFREDWPVEDDITLFVIERLQTT
ncbi:SpoIIE family protein phosphatase, partial [bacterium]|nr:SpoIIE family protein phosphatase [bacterium]